MYVQACYTVLCSIVYAYAGALSTINFMHKASNENQRYVLVLHHTPLKKGSGVSRTQTGCLYQTLPGRE